MAICNKVDSPFYLCPDACFGDLQAMKRMAIHDTECPSCGQLPICIPHTVIRYKIMSSHNTSKIIELHYAKVHALFTCLCTFNEKNSYVRLICFLVFEVKCMSFVVI